ncbi:MAG: putative transcriptional regulator [Planctomycetota bacterium]|jgi:predicted transcriptional regulator
MAKLKRESKLFGSERRTEILLLITLLEETYPGELTRLLDAKAAAVLYIVDGLEAEGIISSRRLGRTRRLALDPRYFAAKELKALLVKHGEANARLRQLSGKRRARPRRTGKGLE